MGGDKMDKEVMKLEGRSFTEGLMAMLKHGKLKDSRKNLEESQ